MGEWIVIVYDVPNSRRAEFRPQHLANLPAVYAAGKVTSCGPTLAESPVEGSPLKLNGSHFIWTADSKEEIIEELKKDIYYKEGVWDLDSATFIPVLSAFKHGKTLA